MSPGSYTRIFGSGPVGTVASLALLAVAVWAAGRTPGLALGLPAGLRVVVVALGTLAAVAVIVWALAYFPRLEPNPALVSGAADYELAHSAAQMEQSWLGRAGKFVEPVFEPLGWDWRVSAAVIAGFPAREVVIAVLGTVYAVGDDADEGRLSSRLKSSMRPDGTPVFTLPMVIGLLIFYACCLQCAATLAIIRRETNSWRWPIFAWTYMTAIGYTGALIAYQLGTA